MLKKVKNIVLKHKIITVFIVLVVIVLSFLLFKDDKNSEASYSFVNVKVSNITNSVTGTGQVEASDTINLGAKISGIINYVGVKAGETVKKGKLIASVDSKDARIALENAQISLAKIKRIDSLDLVRSENSLKESYDNGWNKVSNYITETTSLLEEMRDIFGNEGYLGYRNISNLSSSGRDRVFETEKIYYEAKNTFEKLVKEYKNTSRSDSNDKITSLINQAYKSALVVASASKKTEETFNYVYNYLDNGDKTSASSARADINSWLLTSNSHTNNLLASYNSVLENNESYSDLVSGGDELDIRSAELNVEQKLNAYNDCFVYAPFDGVIATINAKVGESAGSNIGTIITKQKVVTVSLNEVDIAYVKIGQKVSITFDAVNDLNLYGVVSEMDAVGTVSSGVVNYDVKIVLDNDDEKVKAGMSANVEIVIDQKDNILVLPSSAVKTRGKESYVEVISDNGEVVRKDVEIGISNDTTVEIISGLSDNDEVVVRTSVSTSKINPKMMGGPAMGGIIK